MLLLSETWRRADGRHPPLLFNGYTCTTLERSGDQKEGGGLATIYKENLQVYKWSNPIDDKYKKIETERLWSIIDTGTTKYAVLNIYGASEVTTNNDFIEWNRLLLELVSKEIVKLKSEGYCIVVQGDLNGHVGRDFKNVMRQNHEKKNKNGQSILAFMIANQLVCENDTEENGRWITWSAERGNRGLVTSCIDYCLTSGLENTRTEFRIKHPMETGLDSDHNLLELKIKVRDIRKKKIKKKTQHYSLGRSPKYETYKRHALENLKKYTLEEFQDLEQEAQILHIEESLLKSAKHSFPPKQRRVRGKFAGLPESVRDKIKKKKLIFRKIKNKQATEDEVKKYRKLKTDIKHEVLEERGKKRRSIVLSLYDKDPSMNQFWEILKDRSEDAMKIDALRKTNGELAYDEEGLKEAIYSAFKERLGGEETPIEDIPEEAYDNGKYDNILMAEVTSKELSNIISSFKNKKAMGPRLLRFELIKNLSQKALKYLVVWVNKVIRETKINPSLNIGHVKLLMKSGDPTEPTNYRPITVSPILSKMVTKLMNERLVKLVEEEHLLSDCQLGFRPKKSTRTGVYTLSMVIQKIKKEKIEGVLTFIDLKAAYDSVSRIELFNEMNAMGLGGRFQKLIGSLYHQDKIVFEVNGSLTKPLFLKQGVRQGCNLSPTLFNILMKRIADKMQATMSGIKLGGRTLTILLYADDICLISSSPEKAIKSYKLLAEACEKIGLKVNVKKSQIVKANHPGMIILKDLPLEQVFFYKYLGVQLAIARAMYMTEYSSSRLNKAKTYGISTISLARNSPCPALFAWRVWRLVALPAILYGAETVLIRKKDLELIEKEQARVCKFILQVDSNTQNVVAQVLADMEPVEIVYWRRVIQFYIDLHNAEEGSWLEAAFAECKKWKEEGNYYSRVNEMIKKIGATGSGDFERKLHEYSAKITNEELERNAPTCQAFFKVSPEKTTTRSALFGYTEQAKTYHEFLSMNTGLGNRKALDGRARMISCELCWSDDSSLNEIHVLMECTALENSRQETGIRAFIERRGNMTARQLYQDFWHGSKERDTLHNRISAAEEMKVQYLAHLGTY